MSDKHTPLPWTIEESQRVINGHNHTLFQISSDYGADEEWSGTGVAVCMVPDEDKTTETIEMAKANAELIVRAVNNHEKLVEALELIASYGHESNSWPDGICPYGCDTPSIAEKALKAAKGES